MKIRCILVLFLGGLSLLVNGFAREVVPHEVPPEFRTEQYAVTVNDVPVRVFHAGLNVYFASFDFTGQAVVKVTAARERAIEKIGDKYSGQIRHRYVPPDTSSFWDDRAVVRPLSRKVDVTTSGREARFILRAAGQYTVEKPGTGHFQDQVLFLFANDPESRPAPPEGQKDVIYLQPGLHQRNIDLSSGQTLYFAPGAVLFGAINVWDAKDVTIRGRGVVVYDGPQSELRDTGYMHRPNWHPLTTHNVSGLTVEGVTFVGRSRTWSIQMHSTFDAIFDNVKVLAVNAQNVNGDGFDWFGGGRTKILNSLIRSADDCFAFFSPPGNRSDPEDGHPRTVISDVLIENCVMWSTLANIYRIGMGADRLLTENIRMLNSDVIHIVQGEWKAPWSIVHTMTPHDRHGQAMHTGYLFEDIRFEESTAFLGIQNEEAIFRDIVFRNVSMTGVPVPSYVRGNLDSVTFENVTINGQRISAKEDIPMRQGSKDIANLVFK